MYARMHNMAGGTPKNDMFKCALIPKLITQLISQEDLDASLQTYVTSLNSVKINKSISFFFCAQ